MQFTQSNLVAIYPILIVMLTGMAVLLADSCIPFFRARKDFSAGIGLVGIGAALGLSIRQLQMAPGGISAFAGSVTVDAFSTACSIILLAAATLAILLATTYLETRKIHLGEYYALVLFSTSGAMLMAVASELIVLFIAIEILSVALYVMSGFARTEERSEEAALKYFLLGAFAAGFLLYGIALIYGGSAGAVMAGTVPAGTTNLSVLNSFLTAHPHPSIMLMAGISLVLVGLAFKAALVPFHMWTPDVYEGAPTSVTAYMAASAKIGAFAAILRLFHALTPISDYWLIAIQMLAVLTMFGGNILAVLQDNVKRMLAYSSIAHAGYIMVAVSAAANTDPRVQQNAISSAVVYLLAYTLMTMGAFAVLIRLSRAGHDVQTLNDLKGLVQRDPLSAYTMVIFMLSLGGIPPTVGFMGKAYIFFAAVSAGQAWLAIALALASTISIFYYLKVVWVMCFQETTSEAPRPRGKNAVGVSVALLATGAGTIVLGLAPRLMDWLTAAIIQSPHP